MRNLLLTATLLLSVLNIIAQKPGDGKDQILLNNAHAEALAGNWKQSIKLFSLLKNKIEFNHVSQYLYGKALIATDNKTKGLKTIYESSEKCAPVKTWLIQDSLFFQKHVGIESYGFLKNFYAINKSDCSVGKENDLIYR